MGSFPGVVSTKKRFFFIYTAGKSKSGSPGRTDFQISVVSQWHSKIPCQGTQARSELVLSWVSLGYLHGQGRKKGRINIFVLLDHFCCGNG